MKAREWTVFVLLGLIWGSSFLWIRIAVQDIGPFTLVALRLLFGVLGLVAVMAYKKQPVPRDKKTLLSLAIMGVINTALPFTLISWGETRIESSLASILNGTVPLFAIIIAHLWLHDERITLARIIGLIVGFIGVVVLVGRDFDIESLGGNFLGQLAVIIASISYAMSATFSRKYLRGQVPVVQATMSLLVADALLWLSLPPVQRFTPSLDAPNHFPTLPITWFAIVWLGILGSCVAYLLFFYLLNTWGVTRSTLVTYIFPVVGLILGIVFLDETLDWRLVVGSVLVVSGIAVVNLRPTRIFPRMTPRN
jgi:drug/metabolite transporter (DMT)-like permease